MSYEISIILKLKDEHIKMFEDELISENEIEANIIVDVTLYIPSKAGKYLGLPENCYPDEPSQIQYNVKFVDERLSEYINTIDFRHLDNEVLELYEG